MAALYENGAAGQRAGYTANLPAGIHERSGIDSEVSHDRTGSQCSEQTRRLKGTACPCRCIACGIEAYCSQVEVAERVAASVENAVEMPEILCR